MMQVDTIVENILSKNGDVGALANALVPALVREGSLEKLRALLHSHDYDALKAGIWVASELTIKAKPIFRQDVAPLLRHPAPYVRGFASDCAIMCADDEETLLDVVRLIDDQDSAVRWKAIQFFICTSTDQLTIAKKAEREQNPSNRLYVEGLEAVLTASAGKIEKALSLLASNSPTLRRFALAAAVRHAVKTGSRRALLVAQTSTDEEIQSIAAEELGRL
jgi:hypothetical protein